MQSYRGSIGYLTTKIWIRKNFNIAQNDMIPTHGVEYMTQLGMIPLVSPSPMAWVNVGFHFMLMAKYQILLAVYASSRLAICTPGLRQYKQAARLALVSMIAFYALSGFFSRVPVVRSYFHYH